MFDRLIWVIDELPHAAPLNMAIDEALLQSGGDCALFRAYRWQQRPVSIGYFSLLEQAKALYPDREIVRRWTGGGIVEHGEDFTYSLLVPVGARPPLSRELYRRVHTAIAKTLLAMGCSASVVGERAKIRSDVCFDRAVESDVEVSGNKVAGAAMRRLRIGIMLQGSVQRIPIAGEFASQLVQTLARSIEKRMLSRVTTLLAERIANEKYGTESWTRRY